MFTRRLSVDTRLKRGFELLAGVLVAGVLVGSTGWFLVNEHDEARKTMSTFAAMLASHSEAAMMFDDADAIKKDLAGLRHFEQIHWAVTINRNAMVAQYGNPPRDLPRLRADLAAAGGLLDSFTSFTLSQPVNSGSLRLGEIIIHADYNEPNLAVLQIFLSTVVLAVVLLWFGMRLFARVVATVSAPLSELVKISDDVAAQGDMGVRAAIDSPDEVGRLAAAFNRMLDAIGKRETALTASRDELRSLGLNLQTLREEERARIAHAIHDELGQQLTGLKLAIARLGQSERLQAGASRNELVQIGRDIDRAVATVRSIAWELRPSILDALGLPAAIEWLAEDFRQRMGIRCMVTVPQTLPRLKQELATDVFRSCQELLTNVMRHAKATRVEIRLEIGEGLRLEVADNGEGMANAAAGRDSLGLLGLRERALRWGRSFETGAAGDGRGTRAVLSLPRQAIFQRGNE